MAEGHIRFEFVPTRHAMGSIKPHLYLDGLKACRYCDHAQRDHGWESDTDPGTGDESCEVPDCPCSTFAYK